MTIALLLAVAPLVVACSGDPAATRPPDPPLDASPEILAGETVSFLMASRTGGEYTWSPLSGVLVTLDAPGGARQEALSVADGRVTFFGVDWSAGNHTVTAFKAGYIMTSWTAINAAALADTPKLLGAPGLWLQPIDEPSEAIRVTGSATGLVDPSHTYLVNVLQSEVATDWLGFGRQPFSVWAPSATPFILQGLEFEFEQVSSGQGQDVTIYRVAHQPVEPSADNLFGLELDFDAWAMDTFAAAFTWPLPTRAESPLRRGTGVCVVASPGSRYTIGWAQHLDIAPTGDRFDVSMLWVEPHWAPDAITQLRIHTPSGTALAVVDVPGYPVPGMSIPVPLDVPELERIAAVHPIGAPLHWTWYGDAAPTTGVDVIVNDRVVWRLRTDPDARTLTFPRPPTGVDLEGLLSATPRLYVWGADSTTSETRRWVRSLDLGLEL